MDTKTVIRTIAARWEEMDPTTKLFIAERLGGAKHVSDVQNFLDNLMVDHINTQLTTHLKRYGYDSLCWRYKCAREQQALYEIRSGANPESARKMANRDVMRFCQILDDLIGEHD